MNPFPFVRNAFSRNLLTALVFMVLIAVTAAPDTAFSARLAFGESHGKSHS